MSKERLEGALRLWPIAKAAQWFGRCFSTHMILRFLIPRLNLPGSPISTEPSGTEPGRAAPDTGSGDTGAAGQTQRAPRETREFPTELGIPRARSVAPSASSAFHGRSEGRATGPAGFPLTLVPLRSGLAISASARPSPPHFGHLRRRAVSSRLPSAAFPAVFRRRSALSACAFGYFRRTVRVFPPPVRADSAPAGLARSGNGRCGFKWAAVGPGPAVTRSEPGRHRGRPARARRPGGGGRGEQDDGAAGTRPGTDPRAAQAPKPGPARVRPLRGRGSGPLPEAPRPVGPLELQLLRPPPAGAHRASPSSLPCHPRAGRARPFAPWAPGGGAGVPAAPPPTRLQERALPIPRETCWYFAHLSACAAVSCLNARSVLGSLCVVRVKDVSSAQGVGFFGLMGDLGEKIM